ncbi:MAG: alanyl-tRNA synthetase [Dehalococcoidia bacterium]|nr:alanyl-tRNA synthetase [Dehalococcoidia bacterium]
MTEDDIRESFLRFFESKGHLRIPSSSLIPAGDPTLLLTNAGMVQFKPYFTGEMTPPGRRLTSAQKCFRTTDIDSVGDATHLTFFEMLGNFSVGDYFKREAIAYAWEFVTEHLKLEKGRLWATVFVEDDEAFGYWTETGIPAERIRRCSEKDNFWGPAGSEGPCGPCSEIHYDFGEGLGCRRPDCGPNCENVSPDTARRCDRFMELWNLVFMQYYQSQDGSRTLLPAPNIDTGMGLERCAIILQGKRNIYDTDLFQPIVQKVAQLCGKEYGSDPDADYAMRVVAEHARSAAFLIADGVVPSNEGRGYVLRRVIRRAIRYGKKLGLEATVGAIHESPLPLEGRDTAHGSTGSPRAGLPRVAEVVIELMKGQYPDLAERREFILRVLALEEERFGETFEAGRWLLEDIVVPKHYQLINVIQDWQREALSLMGAVVREIPSGRSLSQSEILLVPINQAVFQLSDLDTELIKQINALTELSRTQKLDVYAALEEQFIQIRQHFPGPYQATPTGIEERAGSSIQMVQTISGNVAFFLYATYGFPPELTEEIAKESGLKGIDWDAFHKEMRKHAETSRGTVGKFGGDFDAVRAYQEMGVGQTTFLGYETLSASSVVVGLLAEGQQVSRAVQGEKVEVVLRETPFYAEMGGQVGDAGEIAGQGGTLRVEDTQAPVSGITVHKCTVVSGSISLGDAVTATVDARRRQDTARNHTATHMLHAALRQVLGTHVRQHGSLVTPDRLRFDFTHVSPLSPEELREVQRLTNEKIRENITVSSQETTYRHAVSQGALAFFGDKYGDQVRVVAVADGAPFSMEVCGGTHVHRTGDIGICLVLSESSIGSGLRRIEAVTGREAEALMYERSASLEDTARRLQASPDQLASRVDSLLGELEQARKRAETLERELLKRQVRELPQKQLAGVTVVSGVLSVSVAELLREAGDWLKNDIKSGVVALGAVLEGRPTMLIMATGDMVAQGFNAGSVVRDAAKVMGGGGGGRAEMGQAGGRDPGKLRDALKAAEEEVRRWREKP